MTAADLGGGGGLMPFIETDLVTGGLLTAPFGPPGPSAGSFSKRCLSVLKVTAVGLALLLLESLWLSGP